MASRDPWALRPTLQSRLLLRHLPPNILPRGIEGASPSGTPRAPPVHRQRHFAPGSRGLRLCSSASDTASAPPVHRQRHFAPAAEIRCRFPSSFSGASSVSKLLAWLIGYCSEPPEQFPELCRHGHHRGRHWILDPQTRFRKDVEQRVSKAVSHTGGARRCWPPVRTSCGWERQPGDTDALVVNVNNERWAEKPWCASCGLTIPPPMPSELTQT